MIKAIQTRYKGYNFRSRLEARWAVFFDALGIQWEYEPEGFELRKYHGSESFWYLPDFWLPDPGLYIEVKGEFPTQDEIDKIEALADNTGKAALLVYGLPYANPSYLCCWDQCDSSAGNWCGWASFLFPASCTPGVICHRDRRVGVDRYLCLESSFSDRWIDDASYSPFDPADNRFPKYAIAAARSARFEHGESGRT